MNAYRSRPLAFPWPPVIYALAIVSAFVLGTLKPLPVYPLGLFWDLAIGAGLVLLALTLDLWALVTLRMGQTTIMPHRRSAHLVTNGPFRFSRNPIYLGYTLMTIAIGFLSSNGWYFVAALTAAVATWVIAIRAEENHLLARFGFEFERYCRHTRCWI